MTADTRDDSRNNGELPNRRSIRLRNYDYSQAGAYFVTICVEGRKPLYGEVCNGCMVRSPAGDAVASCWYEIPRHYLEVELDEFVVMPNHMHGIVVIASCRSERAAGAATMCRGRPTHAPPGSDVMAAPAHNLGTILGSYKSAVTKAVNALRCSQRVPVWQRGYFEHVVRSEEELNRIREYIASNPANWHLDKENLNRTGDDPFDVWLESLNRAKAPRAEDRPRP